MILPAVALGQKKDSQRKVMNKPDDTESGASYFSKAESNQDSEESMETHVCEDENHKSTTKQ